MKCLKCKREFDPYCPECKESAGYNPSAKESVYYSRPSEKKTLRGGALAAVIVGGSILAVSLFYGMCFFLFGVNSSEIVDNKRYYINDTVNCNNFIYTLTKAEFNSPKSKTDENYYMLYITLELENISNNTQFADTSVGLYADDYLCNPYYRNDDNIAYEDGSSEIELYAGKKFRYEFEYQVPKNAENISLCVNSVNWDNDYDKQFKFIIKD